MADTLRHIEPEAIFQNTTTSYKFFWCFALLSLHQNSSKSLFECNDVISRMICEAYFVLDNNKITLGSVDHFRTSMYSLKKLYPRGFGSANEMYCQLSKDIFTKGIRRVIAYYKENVPFRFLTPWAPQNASGPYVFDKGPLSQESIMFPAGAPYIIYKDLDQWIIKLNPMWVEHYTGKHDELKKTVISCLARYIAHRNELSIEQYQSFLEEIVLQRKKAVLPSITAKRIVLAKNDFLTRQDSLKNVSDQEPTNDARIKEDTVIRRVNGSTENIIRAGKVVSLREPDILKKVSLLIGTNRLDAIKLLIDYFDGRDDITMSFKDWGKLLDRIPAFNRTEKEAKHNPVSDGVPNLVKTTIQGSVKNGVISISKDTKRHRSDLKSDWGEVDNAIVGVDNVHDIFGNQEDFPSFVVGSLRLDGMAVSMSLKAWSYKTDKRYIIHLLFNEVTYYHASIITSQEQSYRIVCKKYKNGYKYRIGDGIIYINSGKARVLGISEL